MKELSGACGEWTVLNVSVAFALQIPCVVGHCRSSSSLLGTLECRSSGVV